LQFRACEKKSVNIGHYDREHDDHLHHLHHDQCTFIFHVDDNTMMIINTVISKICISTTYPKPIAFIIDSLCKHCSIKLHLRASKLLSRPCPTGGGVGSKGNVARKLKGRGQQRCMLACEVQELHDRDMQQIDGGWCTLLPAAVCHRAPPAAAARCLLLPMASGSDNRQQQQAAAHWLRFSVQEDAAAAAHHDDVAVDCVRRDHSAADSSSASGAAFVPFACAAAAAADDRDGSSDRIVLMLPTLRLECIRALF